MIVSESSRTPNSIGTPPRLSQLKTPAADCFDDDAATECVPYHEWVTSSIAVIGGR